MSIVEIGADSHTKMRGTRENGIAVLNKAQAHVFAALKDIRQNQDYGQPHRTKSGRCPGATRGRPSLASPPGSVVPRYDTKVTFVEEIAPDINNQIDATYRTKYRRYAASIVSAIVSSEARSATIKLVPRSTSA